MVSRKIVLASQSPRRRELLSAYTSTLEFMVDNSEERIDENATPEEAVKALALQKAKNVANRAAADSVVIGADTMVFVDGETLGKPKSEEEARQMLRRLSGRSHFVCTGFAVVDNRNGKEACGVERTEVKFRSLSENEIEKYIQSKEPMDKAGAYGIQGKGALFIEEIRGDYFNVVGLPLCALSEMLKKEFDIELF